MNDVMNCMFVRVGWQREVVNGENFIFGETEDRGD